MADKDPARRIARGILKPVMARPVSPAEREVCDAVTHLVEALLRAVEWGVASKGHDGGMAVELRKWIDAGMTGPIPPEPDWLRCMRMTLDKAK